MAKPKDQNARDAGLVFAAHNMHNVRCGLPPRLRSTDNPALYHGYFENRYGEQFVFTFDRATGTGTVSGGELGWDNPKAFTLGLLEEALRSTQDLAAQIKGSDANSKLPVIDTALGRLTGLTGRRGHLAAGVPGGLCRIRESARKPARQLSAASDTESRDPGLGSASPQSGETAAPGL